MRILILTNFDVGLYQFRRELIQELLTKNEVYISLPYGELVAPLVEMGCFFFDTPMERRGMNPVRDAKLFAAYRRIFREVKPEKVICYTIKPNIYGGFAARLAGIPYAVNITGLGTAFESGGLLKKMVTAMYRLSCKKAKTVFFENAENRADFPQRENRERAPDLPLKRGRGQSGALRRGGLPGGGRCKIPVHRPDHAGKGR